MRKTAAIALFLLLGLFTTTSLATEVSVFGPKQYLRTKGKPDVYTDAFSAAGGPGRLIVRNGDQSGQNRVSSAVISVNGVQIFGPADFSQQVYALEAPVALSPSNSLSVELRSKPGSFLMIQVVQEVDAPTVTLGAVPATILLGDSSTLSWASNNAASATIDQGIGPVSLSGSLSVSPTGTTTYTITVTGLGGTATASATVTVDNPPPTVTLAASPESILEGHSSTLAWTSTRATSASIDHDVGPVPVNGTLNVSPAETTTYTITVTGPGGTATASATIQVQPQFPTCAATGGDFILSISQPQDGAEIPRDQGPCIQVAGSVDPAVGFSSKEGRRVTVNGEPALLTGDTFSGNACLAFGPNEILVQAVYWEQSCRDEGGQTVCELLERHGWAKLCVYYSHLGAVDVMITAPQDNAVVYTSPVIVRGIVSPPDATVVVNGVSAQGDSQGRFQASVTLSPGSNAITATGTFNGNSASSQITLIFEDIPLPVVRITSPVNGAVLASTPITVTGTVNDDRIAVMVNEIAATVAGGVFTAANVPLQIGPNTITATGTNPRGTGSDSVSVVYQIPLPTATLTASPESIIAGQSSALSWTTTNATSAAIEPGIGSVSPNGTMSVSPAQTTTYTITATGPGGTATASATVTVTQPLPAVTLSASPESILPGQSAALSWSSTNATSASIQPGIGDVPVTGSTNVSPTVTTTYAITVTGPGGTNTATATVSVVHPPPTVSFSASPTSITQGESSALSWSSANAETATISPGIGSVPVSGTQVVSPTETTTYTITATGPGGTTSQSVTVMVESQPQWCGAWWGDFEIRIDQPQDGSVIPRQEGPYIRVTGSVDLQVPLSSLPVAELTVNGVPATLGEWDNSYWAEICLGFGNNEVLVEAGYWEEVCWEENGEQVCQWEGRRAWSKVCVYYGHSGIVDLVITSPQDGATVRQADLVVQGIVTPVTAAVTVNGTSATVESDGRFQTVITLLPGANTITAIAVMGGQSASANISVTYEEIRPPVVRITSPVNGARVYSTPIPVSGTVDDSSATVRVNGVLASVSNGTFTATGVPLTEGTNTITAMATNAGGTSSDSVTIIYEEPKPPLVYITDPQDRAVVDGALVTVSGSVDRDDARVWVNGVEAVVEFGSFEAENIPLKPGANRILATASRLGKTGSDTVWIIRPYQYVPQPEGSFGALYEDLVPPDAMLAQYDSRRFALITGMVLDLQGAPIPLVSVTVHDHPEYGTAFANTDGRFSIPVEGGSTFTAVYQAEGLLTAHRKVAVPVNDTAIAETLVMIGQDGASTTFSFSGNPGSVVTHRSSDVSDQFGSRSATLVFKGDNRAYEVDKKDQVIRTLGNLTVRATEYTTPESMPAKLPPNSGYTYCVELTVDGVERVRFDKPLVVWVDNFLNFGVGEAVPVGYYDRDMGIWVPSDNGRVVRLLDTDGDGVVNALDADNDGQPDDLNGSGSFEDEVVGLTDSQRYPPGATFWRVAVSHFTPSDFNWPTGPARDAIGPNGNGAPSVDDERPQDEDCETSTASSAKHRSRVLHEDIQIPGTDVALHYASDRARGHLYRITVPASGDSVPSSLKRIVAIVDVAGRTLEQVLDPLPNQVAEFTWDGMDHLGRPVSGHAKAHVRVAFVYDGWYYIPNESLRQAFAQAGGVVVGPVARADWPIVKDSEVAINVGHRAHTVAEGWTLSVHHHLNPLNPGTLFKGDGTISRGLVNTIETVAGDGGWIYNGDGIPATQAHVWDPYAIAFDAWGNLYLAQYESHRIRKVDTSGIITTVAGNGADGYSGDGGPATQAQLFAPTAVAVDGAGNLYIVDTGNHRIRKVDPNGIITTVAGGGTPADGWGDGGPATNARLFYPGGVAVDALGNVYIANESSWMGSGRIRKVDPTGTIETIAGPGEYCPDSSCGDGGPAVNAQVNPVRLALDGSGNLYFSQDGWVRKIDQSGIISTVAGSLWMAMGLALDGRGNLFVADWGFHRVVKVDSSGLVTITAGGGTPPDGLGDGGPATQANISNTSDVAVDASGNLYVTDNGHNRVRKVVQPSTVAHAMMGGDMLFAEESGLGHVLTSAGRHRRTVDLNTGAVLKEFGYDASGNLVSITDRFGRQILISRDANGRPTAITSPDGVTTNLTVDASNHLTQVTYPDGRAYGFEYTTDGLLSAKVEPRANRFEHVFDFIGRLTDAIDQEGGHWQFSRQVNGNGDILNQVLTAEGDLTSYLDHHEPSGRYESQIVGPTGAETVFGRSADGLSVNKSLPCGMELGFEYGIDPEYRFQYLKTRSERTPSSLERTTVRDRIYEDSNHDQIPDRITEAVTVSGKTTSLVTDTFQSKKTVTSPTGRTVQSLYDPATLLTTSLNIPGLYATSFGYDTRGRLTTISTNTRHSAFTYDGRGNLSTLTDPLGRITTYDYDLVGRMTGIHRPDGSALGFQYDPNGNMTVMTVPSGVGHGFGYNLVDLNSAYETPLSGTYSYLYDRDRRLKQINFPSGRQIRNIYANGRLNQIQTPEGNIDFSYLCGSKVDTIARAGEAVSYGYDGSLLTSEILSGSLNATLSYAYNHDFNVTTFSYAGGTVGYAYDNDGLLVGSGAFTISRDAGNGFPVAVAGGALTLGRGFNGYGELDQENATVGGRNVSSWTLARDSAGRITSKTETVGGVTYTYVYSYDTMGRLRTVTRNSSLVEEYQYDGSGRRSYEFNVLRGIPGRVYGYSTEDHLLTAGDTAYQYDFDGFQTAKTRGTELTQYFYSSRGELLGVVLANGMVVEYVHDPLGRRIAKKVNGAVTEKYLWQGMTRLLAVCDGNNNLVMRFLYADARMPVAMSSGGATYYLSYDQVGSLRAVTDAAGNVIKRVDYDSFGNIVADSNPAAHVPCGFAGGLHDRDTGLVRFGFRDYDPETGRWSAKDPIRFRGGNPDLYAYCVHNPISFLDRLGLIAGEEVLGNPGLWGGLGAAAEGIAAVVGSTASGTAAAALAAGLVAYLGTSLAIEGTWLAGGLGADTYDLYKQITDVIKELEAEAKKRIEESSCGTTEPWPGPGKGFDPNEPPEGPLWKKIVWALGQIARLLSGWPH